MKYRCGCKVIKCGLFARKLLACDGHKRAATVTKLAILDHAKEANDNGSQNEQEAK